VADRRKFEPLPNGFVHVLPPYCYRCPWGKSPDSCHVECAQAIEDVIRHEGRDTVSAVIVDPVMAAAGVLVPPKAYYQRLRRICDENGIVLIFDEVLTGFGRVGSWFACQDYGVVPDLICLGKGITAGYVPVAAVVARRHIAAAFRGDASRTFLHGHTYGGYPLGCDTALAVIDELLARDLVAQARASGAYLETRLHDLATRYPEIGDVRGVGMLWGLEFVSDRVTKEPFPPNRLFAPAVREKAQEFGMLCRGSAHVVILAPALVATKDDLDEIVSILDRAISAVRADRIAA
jgi:adenosylmethionine-8-amino-7-oxononanoate aminotransferase